MEALRQRQSRVHLRRPAVKLKAIILEKETGSSAKMEARRAARCQVWLRWIKEDLQARLLMRQTSKRQHARSRISLGHPPMSPVSRTSRSPINYLLPSVTKIHALSVPSGSYTGALDSAVIRRAMSARFVCESFTSE